MNIMLDMQLILAVMWVISFVFLVKNCEVVYHTTNVILTGGMVFLLRLIYPDLISRICTGLAIMSFIMIVVMYICMLLDLKRDERIDWHGVNFIIAMVEVMSISLIFLFIL